VTLTNVQPISSITVVCHKRMIVELKSNPACIDVAIDLTLNQWT
jgi:hypothetical protein